MTAPHPVVNDVERKTLAALADLAAARKGFMHRRVRGWVPGPEVKDVTGVFSGGWRLPRLRQVGFVCSDPVPDAGRARNPVRLWRITQAGEDEVARLQDRPPRRIPKPRSNADDRDQIYMTRRDWNLLSLLQRLEGPVAWEAARAAGDARRGRFHLDDLTVLLKRGFVVRENRGTKTKPKTWVAVTSLGRQVQATDVKSGKWMVKLRVGGCEEHT